MPGQAAQCGNGGGGGAGGGAGGGGAQLTKAGKELLKASTDLELVKSQLVKTASGKSNPEPAT